MNRFDYGPRVNGILDQEINLNLNGFEIGMISSILEIHRDNFIDCDSPKTRKLIADVMSKLDKHISRLSSVINGAN